MEKVRLEANLIELVKDTPFLYDVELFEYKNETLKTERFQEIGDLLGLSGDAAKKLWEDLIARYMAYLKESDQPARASKIKFQHAKILEFLQGHIKRSKSSSILADKENALENAMTFDKEGFALPPTEPDSICVLCCKSLDSFGTSQDTPSLLERELRSIFIVQKLLGVPRTISESLLGTFGNPSNWMRICWTCEDLVNESKSLYDRIQHLTRSLQKLKDAAVKKVKESDGKQKFKMRGAAGCIRQVVLKGAAELHGIGSLECFQKDLNLESGVKDEVHSEVEEGCNFRNEAFDDDDNVFYSVMDYDNAGDFTKDTQNKRYCHGEDIREGDKPSADSAIDKDKMGNAFTCFLCGYRTNIKRDYIRHRRDVHWKFSMNSKAGQLKPCKKCGKSFKDATSFRNHCLKNHEMVECQQCPRLFSKLCQLKCHITRVHKRAVQSKEDGKNPVDNEGDADSKTKEGLDIDGSNKCDQCNFAGKTQVQLDHHVRVKHWIVPRISRARALKLSTMDRKCTVCNETFRGGSGLKEHCLDVHKMLLCRPCNRLFVTKFKLDMHKDKKHKIPYISKPHKCHFCSNRFAKSHQLRTHLRHSHWAYVRSGSMKARKCGHCGKVFKNMDNVIKHSITDHGALQCEFCPRLLATKEHLRRHLVVIHNQTTSTSIILDEIEKDKAAVKPTKTPEILQCPYCTMCTKQTTLYKKHMDTVHYEITCRDKIEKGESVTLKCHKCAMTSFQSVDELLQHKENVHKMFKCEICLHCLQSKGYRQRHWQLYHSDESIAKRASQLESDQKNQMTSHAKIEKSPAIKCEECDETFDSKIERSDHIAQQHPEKLFKCDDCPETEFKAFETLGKLYAHKVLIHNEPNDPYRCKLCDYTSKSYRCIEVHKQRMHLPKLKLICEICSKKYSCQKYLDWHKIQEHGLGEGKNKFEKMTCNICNKVFSTPTYLKRHTAIYHLGESQYKCTYEGCTHRFQGQKQLDLHIRLKHTKEGYIKCPHDGCKKQFGTKQTLSAHFKRCHEPKKLKCGYCDYATNDAQWLKTHVDVHENAETKPFQCDYCGKSFPAFRYLTQHFNSHIRSGEMNRADVPTYKEFRSKINFTSVDNADEKD